MKTTTHARVRLTVDIMIPQGWEPRCDLEQVFKQARESAIDELRRGLVIEGLANAVPTKAATIGTVVGEPVVTAVVVSEAK